MIHKMTFLFKMTFAMLLLMSLLSCRTRVIKPVEVPRYHERDSVRIERDTIRLTDSVRIERVQDTVFVNRVRYVDRVREVAVQTKKNDSIPTIELPEIVVEKPPAPKRSNPIIYVIIAVIVYLIVREVRNLKNIFK